MEFKNRQAIFLQIADYVSDQILTGKWVAGERIISIRDLAIKLEVNPNTVLRAYEHLQQQEVIYNTRGVGYFVSQTAQETIREIRKQKFFDYELPELIKKINLLKVDLKIVVKRLGG